MAEQHNVSRTTSLRNGILFSILNPDHVIDRVVDKLLPIVLEEDPETQHEVEERWDGLS